MFEIIEMDSNDYCSICDSFTKFCNPKNHTSTVVVDKKLIEEVLELIDSPSISLCDCKECGGMADKFLNIKSKLEELLK